MKKLRNTISNKSNIESLMNQILNDEIKKINQLYKRSKKITIRKIKIN